MGFTVLMFQHPPFSLGSLTTAQHGRTLRQHRLDLGDQKNDVVTSRGDEWLGNDCKLVAHIGC